MRDGERCGLVFSWTTLICRNLVNHRLRQNRFRIKQELNYQNVYLLDPSADLSLIFLKQTTTNNDKQQQTTNNRQQQQTTNNDKWQTRTNNKQWQKTNNEQRTTNAYDQSYKWSSGWTGLLQMIIQMDRLLSNDNLDGPASCKWSSGCSGLLQNTHNLCGLITLSFPLLLSSTRIWIKCPQIDLFPQTRRNYTQPSICSIISSSNINTFLLFVFIIKHNCQCRHLLLGPIATHSWAKSP